MSQLPVPGVRNVMGGLIGPYEKRKSKWQKTWGHRPITGLRWASLLGAAALSITAGVAFIASAMATPAHGAVFHPDIFAADQTAPIVLAGLYTPAGSPHMGAAEKPAPDLNQSSAPEDTAAPTPTGRIGFSEWINVAAVLTVVWIALRTERLRRQSDDSGRFRRLHERMDDHSRRLAAHETRLHGLPTHKDLARIDARLIAVEQTIHQIAHSVTRMEDFLINGVAANAAVGETLHDA